MLEIRGLTFSLGDFSFTDLNLKIEDGKYCIILGPTGAGKTILLETIAGIYKPKSGRIILNGEDITDVPPEKRGFGMVYQDYMLFPKMTVGENIGFGLARRGVSKDERVKKVKEVSETLGIDHLLDRYPSTLSGGEQQRAAIGRVLLLKPKVLLLDEPLSALDTITRENLRSELKRIHKETGSTIIHITHHFEDLYSLAEQVVVMKCGKIIQDGTPDEILHKPVSDFVANFTGMANIFSGTAKKSSSGLTEIKVGDSVIYTASKLDGEVKVGIRPEDIIISNEPVVSSAQNTLCGEIIDISENGFYSKVSVDVGDMIVTAAVTPQSAERLGLKKGGKKVYLVFKASAVHIYKD